jgi:hypothetical protein
MQFRSQRVPVGIASLTLKISARNTRWRARSRYSSVSRKSASFAVAILEKNAVGSGFVSVPPSVIVSFVCE